MSEPNLKLCPFCGGKPYLRNRHDYWRVECEDCPVQISMDTAGDCVEAWNRRAPCPPGPAASMLARVLGVASPAGLDGAVRYLTPIGGDERRTREAVQAFLDEVHAGEQIPE